MDINTTLLLLYALWGLTVGLMVGFTSIGIGLVGTPGLMVLFGFEPVIAAGTMGLAGFTMMLSGVIQHYRHNNIELRIAGLFSCTAIPASFFAARYADAINQIIPLKIIIGSIIILSTILLFFRYVILKPQSQDLKVTTTMLVVAPFLGAVLGTLMGATSISGSIIVLSFLLILKLPNTIAVGTTSGVSAIALAIAAIPHGLEGHIDWQAIAGLIPGTIAGASIGARFVTKAPVKLLRYAMLGILVAAGAVVLFKT